MTCGKILIQKNSYCDYKSTYNENFERLKKFDAPYLVGYKRQAEIYLWILTSLELNMDPKSFFYM